MDIYVLDANAIRSFSYEVLENLKNNSSISIITTEDIAWEVRNKDKIDVVPIQRLNANVYAKMAEILNYNYVKKLLDYYENKGMADVSVLAYILTVNDAQLPLYKYILVSNDQLLLEACSHLYISALDIDSFKTIVDI